jgi:hypothetical protein
MNVFIFGVFIIVVGIFIFNLNTDTENFSSTSTITKLDVQPLRQIGWGMENDSDSSSPQVGMCGETSIKEVMLYYGNYVSQMSVYNAGGGKTLLLGQNDKKACSTFPINFTQSNDNVDTIDAYTDIINFIKTNIDKNYPVICGLFVNEKNGDKAYDHIITVLGYATDSSGNINTLYYNDHYVMYTLSLDCTSQKCFKTRKQCTPNDDIYNQPYSLCIPNLTNVKNENFNALVITGNKDPLKNLYPVNLKISESYEPDNNVAEDGLNEPPIPIHYNAIISGLTQGKTYILLRFDSAESVPSNGQFVTGKWSKKYTFLSNTTLYTITEQTKSDDSSVGSMMSNGTYFFRCVESTTTFGQNSDKIFSLKSTVSKWKWSFPSWSPPSVFDIVITQTPTTSEENPEVETYFNIKVVDSNGNDISSTIKDPDGNYFMVTDSSDPTNNSSTVGFVGIDGNMYTVNAGSWYFETFTIAKSGTSFIQMSSQGACQSILTPV